MKELITRVEELAVQLAGAQLQIDKSEAESRELGRELGKARQKIMELVNERDHALARVPTESWAEENKRLAAQSEDLLGVIERRELLIKSLNDEITKRDHELRAHEKELAEQREEIRKLRAEVPLESTRDVLMNAVANMHELTKEKDRMRLQLENARADVKQALVERDSLGSMAADRASEIRKLMDGHAEDMKAQAELLSKYESLLTKITDLGSYAMTLGRKEGEPLEMFMERQALRLAALESKAGPSIETLSVELSRRYAEIAELHKWATGVTKSGGFAVNYPERTMHYRHIVDRINSRPQIDLTATLPTVDWQLVARNLEQTISGLNAKVAELEAQAGKIGYVAKREHEEAVTAARENGIHKGESLSGFIWRQCEGLRKSQAENAPLNKLFVVLCKQRGNLNEEIIYRAVDEASDAIKKLTA
jgi:hypothetical protein